jgi:hypothetical protein
VHPSIVLVPLRVGFGRVHIRGWTSQEGAWLIEAASATQAERMYALPPHEAERWVRLADLELSPRVEQRLLDHEVLVLVHRAWGPSFRAGPPPIDFVSDDDEPVEILEPTTTWIELEVLTAGGAPAVNARYALTLPDGEVVRGRTDTNGMIRHHKLTQDGECSLRFPGVDED